MASSTGAGSGEVMIKKVVPGSANSWSTARARSANPSTTLLRTRKNALRSASRSTPVTCRRAEKTRPLPRAAILAAAPVGAVRTFSARPSRNRVSRWGASRKSSALREGGVSRTIVSNRPEASSS